MKHRLTIASTSVVVADCTVQILVLRPSHHAITVGIGPAERKSISSNHASEPIRITVVDTPTEVEYYA